MSDLRMIEFEMEDGSKAIWNMDHVMTIRKHDDAHVAIFDSKGDKHIANVTYNELHHVVSDSFPHPHRSQEDFEAEATALADAMVGKRRGR